MPSSFASQLTGANLVAGAERVAGPADLVQIRPRTAAPAGMHFHTATGQEITDAVAAAADAASALADSAGAARAALLTDLADRITARTDLLVAIADEETGLGETRLRGEVVRTAVQLRMFADLVRAGEHLDAVIDTPDPDAVPPLPDLRRYAVPVGPVAVFSASNFPFAFSVAGGDTASALAAGCPVVVKAHPAHPATSELTARLVLESLVGCGLPPGCFSLLHGAATSVGTSLVAAPEIAAVGFTGSLRAGRALFDIAMARPTPIPVYAEMGSTNPVVVTEAALHARADGIARGLAVSFTLGSGQFCTKPGVVLLPAGEPARKFAASLAAAAQDTQPGVLLSPQIADGLRRQLHGADSLASVDVLARIPATDPGLTSPTVVLRVTAEAYLAQEELREEFFGPVILLVEYADPDSRDAVLRAVPGSLTATVHAEAADEPDLAQLMEILTQLAGRVIWNGFPTGVAVTAAQHHGGPYPATTVPWATSVGTAAIRRFQRTVAFQNTPQPILPRALRDDNPDEVPRRVNGAWQRGPLGDQP